MRRIYLLLIPVTYVYCNGKSMLNDLTGKMLNKMKEMETRIEVKPNVKNMKIMSDLSVLGYMLDILNLFKVVDKVNREEFLFYCKKLNWNYHLEIMGIHSKFYGLSKNMEFEFDAVNYNTGACLAMSLEFIDKVKKSFTIILENYKRGCPISYFYELNTKLGKDLKNLKPGKIQIKDLINLLPRIYLVCTSIQFGFAGHAIVIIKHKNSTILFDPNVGAIYFNQIDINSKFTEVINKLLKNKNLTHLRLYKMCDQDSPFSFPL